MPRANQRTAVQVIQASRLPRVGRKLRSPVHTFQVEQRPFIIQPFMIAPVLPGETMNNLLLQSRVVSDPIKHKLIGWWHEYYIFYVPHLAFEAAAADVMKQMMLDPSSGPFDEGYDVASTDPVRYEGKGGVLYTSLCLDAVVREFFRDEGATESTVGAVIDDMPIAQLNINNNGLQSLLDDTVALTDTTDLPGVDALEDEIDIDLPTADHSVKFEILREQSFRDANYDDYLRSYGIKAPKVEQIEETERFRPEIIRFMRKWTYPTNTVDPTDGSVASAVSWSFQERANKKRFFKYPGFIFGVTVTRPKLYMGKQIGSLAGYLKSAYDWLPSVLSDNPETSLREFTDPSTTEDGPLGATPTNGYWLDMRDVFLFGDQFLNFALSETDNNLVALPQADLDHKYVSSTDIDNLFAAASPANKIRQDGVVSLKILGRAGTVGGTSPHVT